MNDLTAKQPEQISCINCGAVGTFATMLKERPVEGQKGVTETGLECPECQHWHHSFFMNPELQRRRLKAETALRNFQSKKTAGNLRRFENAKAYYKQRFDAVNKKLRAQLGVRSPSELLAEEQAGE